MTPIVPLVITSTCAAALGDGAFHPPQRLLDADGVPLALPAPGYAAPAVRDIDGDGRGDLVLGLFDRGAFGVRRGLGDLRFGPPEPLIEAQGTIVPGVW